MKAYGTRKSYYEDRKAERTGDGERPIKKGRHKQEHRAARKRARRVAREEAKE